MFWNRTYLLLAISTVLIVSTISLGFLLYKDYRLYNIYGGTAGSQGNLIKYHLATIKEGTKNYFLASRKPAFDIINLLIPEQTIANQTKDFPTNIKEYGKAFYLYPDGSLRKIQLKNKSDNPKNWKNKKKDIRIKLSKKRLIANKRIYNYQQPDQEDIFATYISYYLANLSKIPSPDARIIEMMINGKIEGIFFEYSHIDEIFLRRNMRMPVNIYKGEQYYTEKSIGRSPYLFNNPDLWTKTAVFNQRDKDDNSDLSRFMNLIRLSETSETAFEKLKIVAAIEDWAKFSAFQTLLQSWHNNEDHNMRLISDVWSGELLPIAHDTGSSFDEFHNSNIVLDSSPHSLFSLYNKSSEFLSFKYKFLKRFIDDEILLYGANHLEEILPDYLVAWSRDPSRAQTAMTHDNVEWDSKSVSVESGAIEFISQMRLRHAILKEMIEKKPKANWFLTANGFSLNLKSIVPISRLTLIHNNNELEQISVYFDSNNDGKISDEDILLPSFNDGRSIILSSEFLSNRVSTRSSFYDYPEERIVETQFNLIFDRPINIKNVKATQKITGEEFSIQRNMSTGNTPGRLNHPIVKEKKKLVKWSGMKIIKGVQEITSPVEILPGTRVLMDSDSSLIFKNKIFVSGSKESPVIFEPSEEGVIWGTIALQGQATNGSELKNFEIIGGSGFESENNKYTGMFSIHDAQNILIDGMLLKDNMIYDDTLHFVYVSDVSIKNCTIKNAFADAIDVDISDVSIRGCKIINSGNDGIDSMSSNVLIKDTIIANSGDKGVSVGEDSEVLIISSILEKNNIGVEAKDSSLSYLYNSKLFRNKLQLNAYDKNWQYSRGGEHIVYQTEINPTLDRVKNDKKSATYILGNRYSSNAFGDSRNTYFLDENEQYNGDVSISLDALDSLLIRWNEPRNKHQEN